MLFPASLRISLYRSDSATIWSPYPRAKAPLMRHRRSHRKEPTYGKSPRRALGAYLASGSLGGQNTLHLARTHLVPTERCDIGEERKVFLGRPFFRHAFLHAHEPPIEAHHRTLFRRALARPLAGIHEHGRPLRFRRRRRRLRLGLVLRALRAATLLLALARGGGRLRLGLVLRALRAATLSRLFWRDSLGPARLHWLGLGLRLHA